MIGSQFDTTFWEESLDHSSPTQRAVIGGAYNRSTVPSADVFTTVSRVQGLSFKPNARHALQFSTGGIQSLSLFNAIPTDLPPPEEPNVYTGGPLKLPTISYGGWEVLALLGTIET